MKLFAYISLILISQLDIYPKTEEKWFSKSDFKAGKILLQGMDEDFKKYFYEEEEIILAQTIVFGELMRYNRYQDFVETKSLEEFYVSYGSEIINFSIGKFQMKPSFFEFLEQKQKGLNLHYSFTIQYQSSDETSQRIQRLKRLKSEEWQIRYLKLFMDMMYSTHPSLKSLKIEEKITLLSTAYNLGPQHKLSTLKEYAEVRQFPYGKNFPAQLQTSYASIALEAYQYLKLENQ
ncbi:hypothetical protein [Sediminitomix flava]|uniref:Uncharacterized protein n=1 Tax=Sediminitomix flava TaxID=379075 RepID=A0A315ZFY5_SEDFL|nr:hypothetical protein [Sediminitomix flava]PWJ44222.1 hypothetical protein BC781_101572 [Sediminitomix flava]